MLRCLNGFFEQRPRDSSSVVIIDKVIDSVSQVLNGQPAQALVVTQFLVVELDQAFVTHKRRFTLDENIN